MVNIEIIDLKALIELGVGTVSTQKSFEITTVVCVWDRNRGDYTDGRVYKIHWDNVSTWLLMNRGALRAIMVHKSQRSRHN